jgi:hypothetical protein
LDVGLLDHNLASCVPLVGRISVVQKYPFRYVSRLRRNNFSPGAKKARKFSLARFLICFSKPPTTAPDFMGTGAAGGEGFGSVG